MLITTSKDTGNVIVTVEDGEVELNIDDALTLFGRLSGLLPAMPAPEIERDDEHGWVCPHCRAEVVAYSSLIEYDSHQGESDIEIDGETMHVSQVDTERETMAHLCGHCGKVVGIPDEIEVTWG